MSGRPAIRLLKYATVFAVIACACFAPGCGTTKWSDTARTATEQLLISNAIDSAVGRIDFSPLGEKRIYLDTEAISEVTDQSYLTKTLRQHLAASGGVLCDSIEDSDYVLEVRAGAIGTDRDEMLVGIPATTLPTLPGLTAAGTIPEIPFIKRTKQRGVAKLAVFAYNRHTGRPLWASGNNQSESSARNLWFAGTGPLTKGTIFNEPTFAGNPLPPIMQQEKDRRKLTFADQVFLFRESENVEPLKRPAGQETQAAPQLAATDPAAPPGVPGPYVYPGPSSAAPMPFGPSDRSAGGVDPLPMR